MPPCNEAVKRDGKDVRWFGVPPLMPDTVARSVPRVARVFLLALPGVDLQASACQCVAGGTTDVRPFAVALPFGYQSQQWAIKATVGWIGRKPYLILFQFFHFQSFKWENRFVVVVAYCVVRICRVMSGLCSVKNETLKNFVFTSREGEWIWESGEGSKKNEGGGYFSQIFTHRNLLPLPQGRPLS